MKKFWEAVLGIILAVFLHTVLGKISASFLLLFNAFSWAVVYFSLLEHEIFGAVFGTACGLLQDSLSLGIFGVSGLTKTLLGFGTGFISRKINVAPAARNFAFVLIMAAAELTVWKFLVFFLFGRKLTAGGGLVFLQPLSTAVIVTLLFQITRKMRGDSA